jgi:hypothetical protein
MWAQEHHPVACPVVRDELQLLSEGRALLRCVSLESFTCTG